MKKIIILLLSFMVLSMPMYSQHKKTTRKSTVKKTQTASTPSNSKATILGINIHTTASKYMAKLKDKGYVQAEQTPNYTYFYGSFAGYENCRINVQRNSTTDSVTFVSVRIPRRPSERDLAYETLLKQYKAKFGEPEKTYDHTKLMNWDMKGANFRLIEKGYPPVYIELISNGDNNCVTVQYKTGANTDTRGKVIVDSDI